ncbi:MAG: hypothetical protein FWB75_05910 [Oscillospiraceae bacterium]|nr:hypothetical protein [Oscillospiraceae bacterium]
MTVSIVTALAILIVGALIINSNFIRRTAPAITIDGRVFSSAEFDYFYNMAFHDYSNFLHTQFPEWAGAMMPPRHMLSSTVQDHETGVTWSDFFTQGAIDTITDLTQMYNAARASGFVLSADDRTNMEAQFDGLMAEATIASAQSPLMFPNPMSFIREFYGNSINEDILRSVMEFVFVALSYSEYRRESFTYSEAELEAFYNENADRFDIFRFRSLLVEPERQNPADFTTGDELADAEEEAELEAVQRAEHIYAAVRSEEAFISAAMELDPVAFADPRSTLMEQQGEFLDADFRGWLIDPNRAYGDVTRVETLSGTRILMFVERDDNNYRMAAMRQLLFRMDDVFPQDFALGEEDPGFLAAMEEAEALVRERGEAALTVFQVNGADEQTLLDMIPDFSDDHTEGGFYDEIARFPFSSERISAMRVVPELEEWLFDESRQVGDYELIRTQFGYHLMFFMEPGEVFRDFIALDRMQAEAHEQWRDDMPEAQVQTHWAFRLRHQ